MYVPDVGTCVTTSARRSWGLKWPHGRPELTRALVRLGAAELLHRITDLTEGEEARGLSGIPPPPPEGGPARVSASRRREEVAAREDAPQPRVEEEVAGGREEPAPAPGPDRNPMGGSGGPRGRLEAAAAPADVVGEPQLRAPPAGGRRAGGVGLRRLAGARFQRGPCGHARRGQACVVPSGSPTGPTPTRAERACGAFRPPPSRLVHLRLRLAATGLRSRLAAFTGDAA